MRRYVNLEEISDGKIYDEEDMVKADCLDCSGCSKCCQGMGNSITLDPYDIWRLTKGCGLSMEALLADQVELSVVDGVILPNLKMTGEKEQCAFLNEKGRCSIHAFRPGICRLFPLGRYYEGDTFRYFLQTGECLHPKTKIKVRKWIDTPDYKRNKEFILQWHDLVDQVEGLIRENEDDEFRKNINMMFLKIFFLTPYQAEAASDDVFYIQFYERQKQFRMIFTDLD
ncbi:MAG: YkgJ family cysteine cluster protein [Lachnospiraceae bacterium]|nr:YkgJ family cysteine cluster protein [Lachnospiraceae bacterium]